MFGMKVTGHEIQNKNQTIISKILFVINQSGNLSNGGVISIDQVLSGLREYTLQADQIHILTNCKSLQTDQWIKNGFQTHIRKFSNFRTFLNSLWIILYCLRNGIKIIHANDIQSLTNVFLGAKFINRKIIFNLRGIKSSAKDYDLKWSIILNHVKKVLVLSREMKKRLMTFFKLPEEKINFIYSVVDNNRFVPLPGERKKLLRQKYSIPDGKYIIGMVGVFLPLKQQLDLIQNGLVRYKDMLSDCLFYFVGDFNPGKDEYARKCYEEVKSSGFENNIRFTGYTGKVEDYYNLFDVTIIPTEREGLARSMIESISCGTPVISFDVCSAREILEENNCGIVVKQGDYESLIKKMLELINDPLLMENMKNNAVAASILFQKEKIIEQYRELYSSLNG